jgi:hypothetical protein
MKVYHGSYMKVVTIDLAKCQLRKDFGRGFYVTNLRSQAEYWAKRMGKREHTEGVISEFDFREYVISDQKLKYLHFEGYTEDWLDFIVLNRTNELEQQAHNYDIVEGNVANDDIAARINDYQSGLVSRADFLIELEYKAPNHQICFCTVQSLQALFPAMSKAQLKIIHIDNDIIKSLVNDYDKNEMEAMSLYYKSQTYTLISDESTKFYEKDQSEIYELLLNELALKKY